MCLFPFLPKKRSSTTLAYRLLPVGVIFDMLCFRMTTQRFHFHFCLFSLKLHFHSVVCLLDFSEQVITFLQLFYLYLKRNVCIIILLLSSIFWGGRGLKESADCEIIISSILRTFSYNISDWVALARKEHQEGSVGYIKYRDHNVFWSENISVPFQPDQFSSFPTPIAFFAHARIWTLLKLLFLLFSGQRKMVGSCFICWLLNNYRSVHSFLRFFFNLVLINQM